GTVRILNGATVLASNISLTGSGATVNYSTSLTLPAGDYTSLLAEFVPTDPSSFAGSQSTPAQTLNVTSYVSVTSTTATYTQDFDSLGTTVGAWANQSTIAGWSLYQVSSSVIPTTGLTVDTGTGNSGGAYNYGSTGSSDRAIGGVGSNTYGGTDFAVALTNN